MLYITCYILCTMHYIPCTKCFLLHAIYYDLQIINIIPHTMCHTLYTTYRTTYIGASPTTSSSSPSAGDFVTIY